MRVFFDPNSGLFLERETAAIVQATEACIEAERARRLAVRRQQLVDRSAEGGHVLPFGKYRGVSLEVLSDEDPGYLLWMARAGSDVVMSAELVRVAQTLMRGRCQRCGDRLAGTVPEWKTLCLECWRNR